MAITEAGENPQQDSTLLTVRPPKLHVPKQKIKPLLRDPTTGKSKNSKKPGFTAPAPVPRRLAEPENGIWKGDEWVKEDTAEAKENGEDALVEAEMEGSGE